LFVKTNIDGGIFEMDLAVHIRRREAS